MKLRSSCTDIVYLTSGDDLFIAFHTLRPTLSYQRLRTQMPLSDAELYDKIRRTTTNKHELQVLESFLIFNK